MKSSTDDPYAISDLKSQFIWLVCCNQYLANKTDYLEWEVFDAGLTILNGKSGPWDLITIFWLGY